MMMVKIKWSTCVNKFKHMSFLTIACKVKHLRKLFSPVSKSSKKKQRRHLWVILYIPNSFRRINKGINLLINWFDKERNWFVNFEKYKIPSKLVFQPRLLDFSETSENLQVDPSDLLILKSFLIRKRFF